VVLSVAALVLMGIFSSHVDGAVKANSLALWLGAFGTVVITYNGAMVNSMVITGAPNSVDMVVPFALGLLECAAFAVLTPLTSAATSAPLPTGAQLAHIQWWFLVEAAVSAVNMVLLTNVQSQLTNTLRDTPELATTVRRCQAEVRKAQIATAVLIGAQSIAWLAFLLGFPHAGFLRGIPSAARLRHWAGVAGLVFFIASMLGVSLQERGRRAVLAGLSDATAASPPLRRLRERLTDQYAHHYHLIVSVFKGLPLSVGGFALLAIFATQGPGTVKLATLTLWVASVLVIIATYEGIMVSSIMVDAPPNSVDVMIPFVLGLAEYALFAVLSPLGSDPGRGVPSRAAQLEHLTWWPLVFAVVAVTAGAGIANSKRRIRTTVQTTSQGVGALLQSYAAALARDQARTVLSGLGMVLVFALLHFVSVPLRSWIGAVGALVALAMVTGIASQERIRSSIAPTVGQLQGLADPLEGD
jgi:hypothetical protein